MTDNKQNDSGVLIFHKNFHDDECEYYHCENLDDRNKVALYCIEKLHTQFNWFNFGSEPKEPNFTLEYVSSLPEILQQEAKKVLSNYQKNLQYYQKSLQTLGPVKPYLEKDKLNEFPNAWEFLESLNTGLCFFYPYSTIS